LYPRKRAGFPLPQSIATGSGESYIGEEVLKITKDKLKKYLPFALVFLAGALLGVGIKNQWPSVLCIKKEPAYEIRQGGYTFTNPLLDCETGQDMIGGEEIKSFKNNLQQLIAKKVDKKDAQFVAVYFRDLNNGPWFGINEQEGFSPASLLKVPIMMAYFKLAEANPGLLSKQVVFSRDMEDENLREFYKPSNAVEYGKSYTVEDLIYRMIVYSDNNAKHILLSHIDGVSIVKPYLDMGLDVPGSKELENFMTVHEYASFFRVLFNATYLNREMSEKALEMLSRVEFDRGIPAGVPGITVAHKDRKSTRLNSSHNSEPRMPSSA
jgi:beta-lactamase class A